MSQLVFNKFAAGQQVVHMNTIDKNDVVERQYSGKCERRLSLFMQYLN